MATEAAIRAALAPTGFNLVGAGEPLGRNPDSLVVAKGESRTELFSVKGSRLFYDDWELTYISRAQADDAALNAAVSAVWDAMRSARPRVAVTPDSYDAQYGELGDDGFRDVVITFTTARVVQGW